MPKTTRPTKKKPKPPTKAARGYWLIKSEPDVYAWSQLEADRSTYWDGVRNFEARNNLRAMQVGDMCLFYHSNEGLEIVGVARVSRAAYADPTADPGEDWSVVDVEPAYAFTAKVSLAQIKAAKELSDMQMLTRNRLSVTRVTEAQWSFVHALGKTKVAR